MNKQDKELLLKDLCARLPYKVMVNYTLFDKSIIGRIYSLHYDGSFCYIEINKYPDNWDLYQDFNPCADLKFVKPYLRPLSSMTKDEVDELKMICDDYDLYDECGDIVSTIYGMTVLYGEVEDVYPYNLKIKISQNLNYAVLDYLNAHHFDYRGLIEKGLALPAPEGMYYFK